MEDLHIYNNLVQALRERVPHKASLTRKLVDKLSIEREAVYRRLRGEVPFTLREASILAKDFDISIDSILRGGPANGRHFELFIDDHDEPLETDIAKLGIVIDIIENIKNEPYSELCSSSNTLPQGIFLKYDRIARFFTFKWYYQRDETDNVKSYKNVIISENIVNLQRQYASEAMYIKNSCYIWDNMIFQYLVNDIKYFESIKLLDREDVEGVKRELFLLLDEVEQFAAKGTFENGNKVSFYISNINFDSSYSYIETPRFIASSIKAFTLNRVTTIDPLTFNKLKKWIQSLKRFSTLISESGEIQRVQFFERQKDIIASL